MSILKIARMGHPVLGGPADMVEDPGSDRIRRLAADMAETMLESDGVGLAAPQVHVPLRLVVFHVPPALEAEDRYLDSGLSDDDEGMPLTVLINPEYTPTDETTTESAWEGCLSLPGMTGDVPRFRDILYKGTGLDGERIERQASGFHARVVQHELDHLDGVLFPMRMPDLRRFGFSEEMRRFHMAATEEDED